MSEQVRTELLVEMNSPPLRIEDIVWIEFEILMLSPEYSDVWPRRSAGRESELTPGLVNAIYRIGCERFLRSHRDHLVELGFVPNDWEPSQQNLDDIFVNRLAPWHHEDLGHALGVGATEDIRLLAIQTALFTARRRLLDRLTSTEDLLNGLKRAARRAGASTLQFEEWSRNDVLSEYFALVSDHADLNYIDENGIRRIDFDRLYDLVRDRKKSLPKQTLVRDESEPHEEDVAADPSASGLAAAITNETRNMIRALRDQSPLSAAAIESLEGGSRPAIAKKYALTVDVIRGEERRIIVRLRQALGDKSDLRRSQA